MSTTLYDIPLERLNGQAAKLGDYAGDVLLVVNVASQCGLTPQYEGLEKLHAELGSRGLRVLGFPCNDFGAQEPGTAEEIQNFCQSNYGVQFPMFAKLNVNSAPRHALYTALIAAQPQATPADNDQLHKVLAQHGLLPKNASDVMWNFEKFLIGRDGKVLARFAPDVTPEAPALRAAIEKALS